MQEDMRNRRAKRCQLSVITTTDDRREYLQSTVTQLSPSAIVLVSMGVVLRAREALIPPGNLFLIFFQNNKQCSLEL